MRLRIGLYARVSTARQALALSIDQQLERLTTAVQERGWQLEREHIFRDDGWSGASLNRPGLDSLRDAVRSGELDKVLITAPDRLARNYVHQMIVLDEFARYGCEVEFLDRPMSDDPHDKLLLQIRGAVAEYERELITDRMRRGRLAKDRAGVLLPWTKPVFGYVWGLDNPRDPAQARLDAYQAPVVQTIFHLYTTDGLSFNAVAKHLQQHAVPTPVASPFGAPRPSGASSNKWLIPARGMLSAISIGRRRSVVPPPIPLVNRTEARRNCPKRTGYSWRAFHLSLARSSLSRPRRV
jgi:site-specific DNA recombinase